MKFHHVGLVTPDLEKSRQFYGSLGYKASEIFHDPYQKSQILVMTRTGHPLIELIWPAVDDSPARSWLVSRKAGPYHTCYETLNLDQTTLELRAKGLLPLSEPVPAVAFPGMRAVFLWGKYSGLLELLEPPR